MSGGAWTLSVALLGATLVFTLHAQRRADNLRAAWGDTTTVWVATRPVPAGATLGAADAQGRVYPRSLLPAGALPATGNGDPHGQGTTVAGRVALVGLDAGEVLVEGRLGAAGAKLLERWLTPDTVALPVPASLLPNTPAWSVPGAAVTLVHRNGLVNGQVMVSDGQAAAATDRARISSNRSIDPRTGTEPEPAVLVVVPREQAPTLVAALLDRQLMVALISAPPQSTG